MSSHDNPGTDWGRPITASDVGRMRFRRQWLIARRDDAPGFAWERVTLTDRFELHHHPDARIIVTRAGNTAIVLIGVPLLDPSRGPIDDALEGLANGSIDDVAPFLHGLAGTYVVVHATPDDVTLFTDPAGLMGVYRGHGRVASVPGLLGHLERDHRLDEEFPFKGDNDWYPGDLTPFMGVTALLPNHQLSLESGTTRRFWPTAEPPDMDAEQGTTRLASLLRRNVIAATHQGSVLCSITGGRDSRINVAALQGHADGVRFFTVRGEHIKDCDVQIPRMIAERLGLDHRFVDIQPVEPWLGTLYDQMTGGLAIGGGRSIIGAVNALAGTDHIHLNGHLGALTKSFFWHSRHPRSVRPRSLVKEFVHRPARVRTATGRWLASVPDLAPTTVYNLMYLEQRGGRWMSPGETASNLFYDSVTPFASREVFEAICGLPAATQYGGTLLVDLVRELQPDLAQVPYCRVRRSWSQHVPRRVKSTLKQARVALRRDE